ncbi:MAG: glycosyltransferase family 4 protein [Abitibacteriaceae bacterium]|nr:glycosyltransferase family 4 protein [Abditibacteriaceae bacterium]
MRILYLVPDLFGPPGGIARYCRLVCRALCDDKISLSVVAVNDSGHSVIEAQEVFPQICYAPCSGDRKLFILRALAALMQRPTLVMVGHPNFAQLGHIIASLARAKLVVFLYGIDVWTPLSRSIQHAIQRANRVIAISQFTATQAVKVNPFALDRLHILHNCLDPQFHIENHCARQDTITSILTVARMSLSERYKGHDCVIRAMPHLLVRFPELVYDVVGEGDGRPALEELAKQQGVAHAVRFHGAVSEEELAHRYSATSIYVMPSRFEGFGFVFLEAMAYGKPVIAGNQDASVEVVQHNQTGLLVDPTSVNEIAAAIEYLLANPEVRQHMGRQGAERVNKEFSFPRFRELLHESLRAL